MTPEEIEEARREAEKFKRSINAERARRFSAYLSMNRIVVLDTGPLGIATKRRGVPDAEACRQWIVRSARRRLSPNADTAV
jgi:hypothetical protein